MRRATTNSDFSEHSRWQRHNVYLSILSRMLRPTLVGSIYAFGVAVVSTLGFITGSRPAILLAAILTLPGSVVAIPAFYVVYGLMAQIPGANPSTATGSSSCGANGDCQASTTGDVAAWFTLATGFVGILALTAAALANAAILRSLIAAHHRPDQTVEPRT
jgi:hypothetical protein